MMPASGRVRVLVSAALIAATAACLYAPVARFELTGDDYQLVQLAKMAGHNPSALLSAEGPFRPLMVATLMIDRAVWHHRPAGYHITNLVLHIAAGTALLAVALQLGLGLGPAAALSLLWVLSPFAVESVVWVSARPDTLLAVCWFLIILLWPRSDRALTFSRALAISTVVVAAALSKESWMATPILFLGLGLRGDGSRVRRSVLAAAGSVAAALVYLAVRVATGSALPGQIEIGRHTVAKPLHALAAFLFLEELQPIGFSLSWRGAVAFAVTVALTTSAYRARDRAGLVGAAVLVAGLLPTLALAHLPHRYVAVAHAGFLLLVSSWAARAISALAARHRRTVQTSIAGAVVLVAVAELALVRADLVDWSRVSRAYTVLLGQAAAIAPDLPNEGLVGVIRMDNHNPLAGIASSPRGGWKLLFVRHNDPSGLLDTAALLEWVIDREEVVVRTEIAPLAPSAPGLALAHTEDGFVWLCRPCPDLRQVISAASDSGQRARVVRIATVDRHGAPTS